MAEIAEGNVNQKGAKKRAKRQSTRMDMTPMVDLAFLLLTFFVLTSTFTKPKAMELIKPTEDGEPGPVKDGLTFLLTKDNKVFYYTGEFYAEGNAKGMVPTSLTETSFSPEGIHKLLLEKNGYIIERKNALLAEAKQQHWSNDVLSKKINEVLGEKKAVTVLVKTDDEATYKNAIDMLDELKICDVGKRVMDVDFMPGEAELLKQTVK